MSGPEVPRWQQALFERRNLGVKLDLAAVRAVHAALGAPGAGVRAVHVLGTNGKGSTAAMVAHVLRGRGLRVGLYTSPHLHRVGERLRVDGAAASDDEVQALCDRVLAAERAGPRPLTFFEVLTLAALLHFAGRSVDALVIEAGLGGRLDATRVLRYTASLFTPIALDHMQYLGPTIAAIAGEKAAVMEDGAPAVSAPQTAEAEAVLRATAARCGVALEFVAPLARAPRGLAGEHQRVNGALALAGARRLVAGATAEELDGVVWPGRLERVRVGGGAAVFDVAHNPHGIAALVEALREAPARRVVVFGCLADKDARGMLQRLATLGCPLWLAPLAGGGSLEAAAEGLAARTFAAAEAPELAAAMAAWLAGDNELVVCGSHHLVGLLRGRLLGEAGDVRRLSDPLARG
ncbi:MAG: bifunctional folylpolyglutamate synthase/dihydrofolate synthase [Myxococcales bacterium]|nr:bifunctional folylpolyglutamate synthase/dihydrofolate synthase [Myxococcales bacterium]